MTTPTPTERPPGDTGPGSRPTRSCTHPTKRTN